MWFTHRDKNLGINLDFVKEQRITFETFCQIIILHKERADLFDLLMRREDRSLIKIIFNQLTQIEFELQMLWGFEPDAREHKSWRWPRCECPYSDNRHMPYGLQWVTETCPLHGSTEKKIAPKLNKPKKHVTSQSL